MELKDLEDSLKALYATKETKMAKMYDRSLSFADSILDNRWDRAHRLGFGINSSIYDSALVYGKVDVGKETWIGPSVILDGSGGSIAIGDYCSIAAGVHIYTHDTVLWALSGGKASKKQSGVNVGSCCYIGAQSIILPGVSIMGQSVVAANSVVNKSVESMTVVAGSPARVIGRVEGEGDNMRITIDKKSEFEQILDED